MGTNNELLNFCMDFERGNIPNNLNRNQADELIRKEIIDIVGTATPTARVLKTYENEVFGIIETVLDQRLASGWENNAFFEQFVEYRDLAYGDKNEFYVEDKSMLVVSELADGHWNLNRQKLDIGKTFSVDIKTYGVKVYTDFLRFLAGRIDFIALIDKIEEAMKHKIATEIYLGFVSTMEYLPAQFKHTGNISADEVLEIADHVRASSGYAPIVIAGTRRALRALTGEYSGANSYLVSEKMKDEINQYGEMQMWEGMQLLEIPQVHVPNTFEFQIDDSKLMLLPANTKPIKFVREGESMIDERMSPNDNMDMSLEHTFITRFGIATVFNSMYGMYEIE